MVSRSSGDPASRLLAGAIRLLPAGRREWGRAMRAELTQIDAPAERRRFVLGCARTVLVHAPLPRALAHLALAVAAVAGAVDLSRVITSAPVRGEIIAMAALAATLSLAGRRRGALGPVRPGWVPRTVRGGGYLLTAATVLVLIGYLRLQNADPSSRGFSPVVVLVTGYVATLLAVTAERSVLSTRAVGAGSGLGALAAAAGILPVFLDRQSAGSTTLAASVPIAAIAGAVIVAAGCAGHGAQRVLAGLWAGALTAWIQFVLGHALTLGSPEQRLLDQQYELGDGYAHLLLLGGIMTALLAGAVRVARANQRIADLVRDPDDA